jgi:hypothetical protein
MKYPIPSSFSRVCVGDIGTMHMNSALGFLMAHSPLGKTYHHLTGDDARNCASHSIMFVLDGAGKLCVGNVKNPTAEWQSLEDFAKMLQAGKATAFRAFRVKGSTPEQRYAAAKYWNEQVHNRPYDKVAYGRLIAKVIVGDIFPQAAGLEWAYYCTEGNERSWRLGGGIDVYRNLNPTPVTEIKRWKEGALEEL